LWNEDGSSPSSTTPSLRKIIHVGDAPADILAAKSYVDNPRKLAGLCVGVVGVATGSYSAEELRDLCGERECQEYGSQWCWSKVKEWGTKKRF
jgi:hypothetical protein